MDRDSPEIRHLRETLEAALHPATASRVLFEALQTFGGLPRDPAQTLSLIEGPLHRAVAQRLGPGAAARVLSGPATMLREHLERERFAGPRRRRREEDQTQRVVVSDHALPVLVATSSDRLDGQLLASLGPRVIMPYAAGDPETLSARLARRTPAFVLIDGAEFPLVEPRDLAVCLSRLPRSTVSALWGAELPYGQGVLAAAQALGIALTSFDRREGLGPLLELLRSRWDG
ncbi:MAG: hypothetical protein ACFCGT_23095 [Sandaracinaceae bacterium]